MAERHTRLAGGGRKNFRDPVPPSPSLPHKGGGSRLLRALDQTPHGSRKRHMTAEKIMPTKRAAAQRAWQRMLSGRRLDLLDPSPLDVEIEDIAHGLARVARWNGQTHGAHILSVGQHALLVECIARQREPNLDRRLRLAVLLHDAPEYVIGDMITPFKAVIGNSYRAVEARLHVAIRLRFGLPSELPNQLQRLIKAADRSAAYLEA